MKITAEHVVSALSALFIATGVMSLVGGVVLVFTSTDRLTTAVGMTLSLVAPLYMKTMVDWCYGS